MLELLLGQRGQRGFDHRLVQRSDHAERSGRENDCFFVEQFSGGNAHRKADCFGEMLGNERGVDDTRIPLLKGRAFVFDAVKFDAVQRKVGGNLR